MRSAPYSTSRPSKERPPPPARKKACQNCTKSKVRCDLKKPACSRCRTIGRPCEYSASTLGSSPPPSEPIPGNSDRPYTMPSILCTPRVEESPGVHSAIPTGLSAGGIENSPSQPCSQRVTSSFGGLRRFEWDNIELISHDDAGNIRDRWLRPYILPSLGDEEVPKLYHPFTIQFLSRVLNTYPRCMLAEDGIAPFIHQCQLVNGYIPTALANCFSLVRMYLQSAPGSEAMVISNVEAEMRRLETDTSTKSDFELLGAFQAYLIYAIMLYFSPIQPEPVVNDKTMITLMEIAFRTARNGMDCEAEVTRERPSWESWIVASAKRRSIFTMYLFSSVYNTNNSLPNFRADELERTYVPDSKALWEADSGDRWQREYDRDQLNWGDERLTIGELWRSDATGTPARRAKIDRWLQTVDEFGMMLFSVCVHIHGC